MCAANVFRNKDGGSEVVIGTEDLGLAHLVGREEPGALFYQHLDDDLLRLVILHVQLACPASMEALIVVVDSANVGHSDARPLVDPAARAKQGPKTYLSQLEEAFLALGAQTAGVRLQVASVEAEDLVHGACDFCRTRSVSHKVCDMLHFLLQSDDLSVIFQSQ